MEKLLKLILLFHTDHNYNKKYEGMAFALKNLNSVFSRGSVKILNSWSKSLVSYAGHASDDKSLQI